MNFDVYEIPLPKGAFLVKNFNKVEEQLQIGYEALNDYVHRPYRTNLDGTNGLYDEKYEYKEDVKVEPIINGE